MKEPPHTERILEFITKNLVKRLKYSSGTVPPQMPDTRPDMRQRALFVTSNAACRWNKLLLAELKVDLTQSSNLFTGLKGYWKTVVLCFLSRQ